MGQLLHFNITARKADIQAREILENYNYPFVVRKITTKDDCGWLAEVPQLPGCFVKIEDEEFYLLPELVEDAVYCWLYNAIVAGKEFPLPNSGDVLDQNAERIVNEFFNLLIQSENLPKDKH